MSAKNFVSYGDAETLFTEVEGALNKRTKQLATMPTPSADYLGKIVQYIGPDTTTSPIYKKGKFYECKAMAGSVPDYRWINVDFIAGIGHAMYSEAWGSTDSKSDLIDTLNAFHEDFVSVIEDCDISKNMALYSCYVDTPYEGMPTNTQIKAYYDSDAGWVYRAYSFSTAEDFAIIPTGEAPNITDVTITKSGGGTLYADNPIGSIVPYGGATAPTGWLLCNGQAVSRTTYADLFAAIGTSFGAGDGSTTFNLPDLREATTKGAGLSGKTNNHYDSDGVALGEFVDDRVQDHIHDTFINGDTNYPFGTKEGNSTVEYADVDRQHGTGWKVKANTITAGNHGATTEVKAVGVNYIIKAEHTPVPADFMDAVDEAVEENNSYSTTETVVGRWIDGKPIYRKVFTDVPFPEEVDIVQANTSVTARITEAFPANYISDIVSASFVAIRRDDSSQQHSLPRRWSGTESETGNSMIVVMDASIYSMGANMAYIFEVRSNRTACSNTTFKARAIIEYTKTTD